MPLMCELPVMLNLGGKRCLVVGGGVVGTRRAATLVEAGAVVKVVSPILHVRIEKLGVEVIRREYQSQDVQGMFLVVTATDNRLVNEKAAADAAARSVLVNRADGGDGGDISMTAYERMGAITVSVSTNGIAPGAGRVICDDLADHMDKAWSGLLTVASEYRQRIQQSILSCDTRGKMLVKLTETEAMEVFKAGGEAELREYYEQILERMTD